MYEYRCICICHVYVCNAQTLCLAVAGNRWKLLLIFHASPLHCFQRLVPQERMQEFFFMISLEPLKVALKASLGDTLTRPAAHSFLYSRMESKNCLVPGFRCNAAVSVFLGMYCFQGSSGDTSFVWGSQERVNIYIENQTELHEQRVNINIGIPTA